MAAATAGAQVSVSQEQVSWELLIKGCTALYSIIAGTLGFCMFRRVLAGHSSSWDSKQSFQLIGELRQICIA